jgi:hypothetical protein
MNPRDEMDDDDGIDDDNDKYANLPIANYTTIVLPSIILHNGYSAPSLAGSGHINTVIAERMQVVKCCCCLVSSLKAGKDRNSVIHKESTYDHCCRHTSLAKWLSKYLGNGKLAEIQSKARQCLPFFAGDTVESEHIAAD